MEFDGGADAPHEERFELRLVSDDETDKPSVPPAYLSPSSAGTFSQCARRWKFRYVDRLPDPPGEAALAGTFAHLVLELLMQLEQHERTIERARTIAREVWPDIAADDDYAALELDDDAAKAFRWRGWLAIEGLWTLEDPTKIEVCSTEQRLDTTLGTVPFRGVVDRLESETDGLVVSDYKSGRAPSPRFREDRSAQVVLYSAAVGAERGVRPVRARLLYLGQKTVEVDITDERVEAVVGDLERTWEAVGSSLANDEFEFSVGPLCAWCPYVDKCAEGLAEVTRRNELGSVRDDAPALAHVS